MTIGLNRCVLTPVNLNKWAVVFLEANRNAVQKFCTTMASQGKEQTIQEYPKYVLHFSS